MSLATTLESDTMLVADLLCGAGGFSVGARRAIEGLGRKVKLVAVNHWPIAIETHKKNHPDCAHYLVDVFKTRPLEAGPGRLPGRSPGVAHLHLQLEGPRREADLARAAVRPHDADPGPPLDHRARGQGPDRRERPGVCRVGPGPPGRARARLDLVDAPDEVHEAAVDLAIALLCDEEHHVAEIVAGAAAWLLATYKGSWAAARARRMCAVVGVRFDLKTTKETSRG